MTTTMTAEDFSNLLNSVLSEGSSEPSPEPLAKFKDDPIALACASYRYYVKNHSDRWRNFDMVQVIDEDREQARKIRQYYTQRLMFAALQAKKQTSEFRTKLGAFLTGNHELTVNEIGLLYKLPYFYAEDIALDSIVERTTSAPVIRSPELRRMRLTPLTKIFKSRRGAESCQYWFRSNEGYGCAITVPTNNPLKSIVESLMYRDSFEISAFTQHKSHWNHQTHQYYQLANISLV